VGLYRLTKHLSIVYKDNNASTFTIDE